MSEPGKLIDTSTLSEVIRGRDESVRRNAHAYLERHQRFTFSILTRFEILRGLHAKDARGKISRFEILCANNEILPLSDSVVVKGAEIYARLRNQGKLIDDMDILIAATALVNGLDLITENVDHFGRIPDLEFESWRSR